MKMNLKQKLFSFAAMNYQEKLYIWIRHLRAFENANLSPYTSFNHYILYFVGILSMNV